MTYASSAITIDLSLIKDLSYASFGSSSGACDKVLGVSFQRGIGKVLGDRLAIKNILWMAALILVGIEGDANIKTRN